MRVTREQFDANRQAILAAAGKLFRERGFDGVTVAEIMQAAGLTHGGFYGHFASKDELIAQVLVNARNASPPASSMPSADDLDAYAKAYLSPTHRDHPGTGCFFAALGCEAARGSDTTRAEFTTTLRRQIDRLAVAAPGNTPRQRRRAAIAMWAAMVGAVTLSRLVDDASLSDELLAATRSEIAARVT